MLILQGWLEIWPFSKGSTQRSSAYVQDPSSHLAMTLNRFWSHGPLWQSGETQGPLSYFYFLNNNVFKHITYNYIETQLPNLQNKLCDILMHVLLYRYAISRSNGNLITSMILMTWWAWMIFWNICHTVRWYKSISNFYIVVTNSQVLLLTIIAY